MENKTGKILSFFQEAPDRVKQKTQQSLVRFS